MKQVLKQVLGVDVSQNELVVALGRMHNDLSIDLYARKAFKNKETGFMALLEWLQKLADTQVPVRVVMEATGVYHQKFAHYLYDHGHQVSIVLPNKISNYMRTLENKTITDKSCSEAIARSGLERRLDLWHKPKRVYRILQQLTRERDQILEERVMVKNQLHAEQAEVWPSGRSLQRLNDRLRFLNKQEKEVKGDLSAVLAEDKALKKEVQNICTITGIGELTGIIVLAETNGFELVRSKRQLTSYAGLDVREKQSGTSIKGKPRISKKGNRHLRKAMHLPALSAVKHDQKFREVYTRIVSRHGIKMKGLVAVQRRLLEMVYIIFKSKKGYQKDYDAEKASSALSQREQHATQTGS